MFVGSISSSQTTTGHGGKPLSLAKKWSPGFASRCRILALDAFLFNFLPFCSETPDFRRPFPEGVPSASAAALSTCLAVASPAVSADFSSAGFSSEDFFSSGSASDLAASAFSAGSSTASGLPFVSVVASPEGFSAVAVVGSGTKDAMVSK
jgi:hypothetical protein